MLLAIYKTAMRVSAPLLDAVLKRRAARGKEDVARAGERRGRPGLARPAGALIWLHAASVGESMSLLALIAALRRDYPAAAVLVTTGTVTSARVMAERLPPGAFHQYMPVDHPAWVAQFLDHWRPDFVLWSESELWPNMLLALRERRIPAVLLNARMSERSFGRWRWAKGSARDILSAFSLCLAQNDAEAARLRELGAPEVRVFANLKYGAPPLPFDPGKLEELRRLTAKRRLLLFASTHPGEEDLAAETHLALRREFPTLLTIVVPRHPPRGPEAVAPAAKRGLRAVQRSAGALPGGTEDIYVADTLGELGLFYRLCPVVVVGGSFSGTGGHNPIEPGQLDCRIFFGPTMHNFVTIARDFLERGAAVQAASGEDLQKKLAAALADGDAFASCAAAARQLTSERAPVVENLAALLKPRLDALFSKAAAA
jgi:3-deoxy-D-manno-octulosonic-acid transferase